MWVRLGIWAAVIAGIAIFVAAGWLVFNTPAAGGDLTFRDVVASEISARWAILGVLGALLGNILLFLNLRIAAQATEAAHVAAKAAMEAVDHARITSALELRPYLVADSTNFDRSLEGEEIVSTAFQFGWKNVGATPARNMCTYIDWKSEDAGFDWSTFHFPQNPALARNAGAVGPGHFIKVNSRTNIPITELRALSEGRKEIMVWGALEYDGLDPQVRHRSEHSQRLGVVGDPTDPESRFTSFTMGRHDQADEDALYRPTPRPRPHERKPSPPAG